MSYRHYNSGLSLIEIIIVLALAAILTTIAVSSYNGIVLDSRRKDAQISLLEMQQAIELIRLEHGKLIESEINKLPTASNMSFYQLEFTQSQDSYTVTAIPIGAQAVDAECGNFVLDNLGQKSITGDGDVNGCWD